MFSPHWLHNSLLYCNTDKGPPNNRKSFEDRDFMQPLIINAPREQKHNRQLIKKNISQKHVAVHVSFGVTFGTIVPLVLKKNYRMPEKGWRLGF